MGTRVALTIMGENADIWVWDLARKTMTRLTFDKGNDNQPIWTPDSRQVLFCSEREGKFGGIFRKQADGTGEDREACCGSGPAAISVGSVQRWENPGCVGHSRCLYQRGYQHAVDGRRSRAKTAAAGG